MSSPNGRVPRRPRGIPVPHLSRTSPTRTSPRIRSTMSFPDGRARVRAEGILAPRPSHTSPTRTSPRIPRNPYATASSGLQKKGPVGAVTSAVTSGGTTAVARGGGAPPQRDNAFPPPSRTLSFATPQAEFANRSVSSLSWSTRTPSTKTSAEKHNLSVDPSKKCFRTKEEAEANWWRRL